ncbi:MAG: hypothetical protein IKE24_02430 [Clostridia bacterium]|nr:hypothetical protein [Clostridia bacterium]
MSATKATGTKGRLLFLAKYLMEHTDDDHVLTTADLLQIYRDHGYKCQRTTIPDDRSAVSDAGIGVITQHVPRNETSMSCEYRLA